MGCTIISIGRLNVPRFTPLSNQVLQRLIMLVGPRRNALLASHVFLFTRGVNHVSVHLHVTHGVTIFSHGPSLSFT